MGQRREQRKNEHVSLALNQDNHQQSDFDRIQFVHHAIPSIDVADVTLTSQFPNLNVPHLLYINAMTGGSQWTGEINEKLAYVAKNTGCTMAVGSMHAGIKNPNVRDSYKVVRRIHSDGQIWANVSADVSIEHTKKAIEMIEANALQIHVNAPQELIMPEGSRSFKHWLSHIEALVKAIEIPVIVKEVGFGMSYETIEMLMHCGVKYVDVSGKGGTNFATIENERRTMQNMDYLRDWGQSTAVSLLEARNFSSKVHLLASGGIRHPLDAIKALRLGAEAVGMSRNILLKVQNEDINAAIEYVEQFKRQMQKVMTLLNVKNINELRQVPIVLDPYLRGWMEQRQL
ncbi:type 2 isopentenyl-diphosphate Delta-isomerase [Staphylococcus felis]|uniref:type 2 isopentenyl-diphosphate Delta-isomerase n=1 Tax=Staphylococcus felis TaxID=46127 RepID=UPI0021D2B323|nr:type 2 isopentenyl-diphosphate Delta-isomerase [Staphylococcus felis]UXR87265.1 type 2 isopentenyl-diphosphate Delta-isomerase [Staphylococcus felis]